jgi:hypothetical protein
MRRRSDWANGWVKSRWTGMDELAVLENTGACQHISALTSQHSRSDSRVTARELTTIGMDRRMTRSKRPTTGELTTTGMRRAVLRLRFLFFRKRCRPCRKYARSSANVTERAAQRANQHQRYAPEET